MPNETSCDKAKTTNAERCKRYREKNLEKYRKEDAQRKRLKRAEIAKDPVLNQERLNKQAEEKRLYRLRKIRQSKQVEHPSSEQSSPDKPPSDQSSPPQDKSHSEQSPPLDQFSSEQSPPYESTMDSSQPGPSSQPDIAPTSSFKHNSTRSRSMQRARKALPKSPNKKREVVEDLVKNVLKIRVPSVSDKKRGRPAKDISEVEEKWLDVFIDRADITRCSPRRKDSVYIGKIDGERKYLQIRYLLWTIRETLDIANNANKVETAETFFSAFGKELTFRQLYMYLKKHKEIKWNNEIPHESCTCEICDNLKLFIRGVNSKIEAKLPENCEALVDLFTCNDRTEKCLIGNCDSCPKVDLDFSKPSTETDNDLSDESSVESTPITYYRWTTIDKKVQKVACEMELNDVQTTLSDKMKELKTHLHTHWEQHKTYNKLKNELEPNEMIVHVDFAENYENKQQSEVQSAYFGHTSFSLFTACCYTRSRGELEKHKFVVTTEAKDHSRFAAHCLIKRVVEAVRERVNLSSDAQLKVHLWSDGCASQFRSKFVFRLTTLFPSNWQVHRYYNERHHGKGPMDGLGGCVKNYVFRAVLSEKVVISTPKEFADYANANIRGVDVLYMSISDIGVEPDYIDGTPYIADMAALQAHMIKSDRSKAGFYHLDFYKISTDQTPYYTHWYPRPSDLQEPCGHNDLPESYVLEETCASCLQGEIGPAWLRCPACDQWYHDTCYEN